METEATYGQKATALLLIESLQALYGEHRSEADTETILEQLLPQLLDTLKAVPACALKLKPGEPGFTLMGRDLSAPATLHFWQLANRYLRKLVSVGMTLEEAEAALTARLEVLFADHDLIELQADDPLIGKYEGALQKADAMAHWTPRKLAD